ncbi:hypothetical protein KM043_017376 [Ampulex compressa]|nr:hypothetical protein KM043_017376 [Ampulex compressa]
MKLLKIRLEIVGKFEERPKLFGIHLVSANALVSRGKQYSRLFRGKNSFGAGKTSVDSDRGPPTRSTESKVESPPVNYSDYLIGSLHFGRETEIRAA